VNYSDSGFWFSHHGRLNRRPYFFAGLAIACISEGSKLVPHDYVLLYLPVLALACWIGVNLGIKRCHDRGRSGYFILLNFVPLVNFWPLIELTFLKGDAGPNEYGPDPLAEPAPGAPAAAPGTQV
jgi:uncharacterized membrane protein YhaH (DUF805 family)